MPETFRDRAAPPVVQVVDYVAGMTDRFAVATYEQLIGPSPLAPAGLA
jgi:dGTPase